MAKWFTTKKYGWGWKPASREGWIVIGLFLLALYIVYHFTLRISEEYLPHFFIAEAFLIILLITICYRTGEKPRWRWG